MWLVKLPSWYVVVGGSATATATEQGGGAGGGLPTVTRAILAGGISQECSQYPDPPTYEKRRRTKCGCESLETITGGVINQDTIVQDGDTVVIPQPKIQTRQMPLH